MSVRLNTLRVWVVVFIVSYPATVLAWSNAAHMPSICSVSFTAAADARSAGRPTAANSAVALGLGSCASRSETYPPVRSLSMWSLQLATSGATYCCSTTANAWSARGTGCSRSLSAWSTVSTATTSPAPLVSCTPCILAGLPPSTASRNCAMATENRAGSSSRFGTWWKSRWGNAVLSQLLPPRLAALSSSSGVNTRWWTLLVTQCSLGSPFSTLELIGSWSTFCAVSTLACKRLMASSCGAVPGLTTTNSLPSIANTSTVAWNGPLFAPSRSSTNTHVPLSSLTSAKSMPAVTGSLVLPVTNVPDALMV
eukprot:m.156960 g.156960  ORF g.156960 m.156960 type:complete len:310 (-) comp11726_c1_seq15:152-1081(-)